MPTVAVEFALVPPAPVQVIEKVVLVPLNAPLDCIPDVANVPLQPLAAGVSEAVQAVVLAEFHVSVTAVPLVTLLAEAVSVTVGAGDTSSPYRP